MNKNSDSHQAEMFAATAVAGGAPAVNISQMPALGTPEGRFEDDTGLDVMVFVEASLCRLGVQCRTGEEMQTVTSKYAERLIQFYAEDPKFGEWLASHDDPRPLLCALLNRWIHEPNSGLNLTEAACATCWHRSICPNVGFENAGAGKGHTYKVIIPCAPTKKSSRGKAVSLPCTGYPLYDFAGAKGVIESYQNRKPGRSLALAPWAIGRTQKFDAGCLKYGIADPIRE